MKEEKASKPNMDAVLADEVLVKKLAAKVLDIIRQEPDYIRQKPDYGLVCQGYYCDVDDRIGDIRDLKELWGKQLNALDMVIEDGLAESAADEYPLSADELDQVVTEIKTSDDYADKLSGNDLSQAVGKVLADNEMMRRKGTMRSKRFHYEAPEYICLVNGPNKPLSCNASGPGNLVEKKYYCYGGHSILIPEEHDDYLKLVINVAELLAGNRMMRRNEGIR